MSKKPSLPSTVSDLVEKVGKPVTTDEVDTFVKVTDAVDQSHFVRTIVGAWRLQQGQERKLREKYAFWLIVAMFVQAALVNIAFFGVGCGWVTADPGTSRTFIVAVFSEIAAMVFFIVKYLFRPGSDEVLKLAGAKPATSRRSLRGNRGDRLP